MVSKASGVHPLVKAIGLVAVLGAVVALLLFINGARTGAFGGASQVPVVSPTFDGNKLFTFAGIIVNGPERFQLSNLIKDTNGTNYKAQNTYEIDFTPQSSYLEAPINDVGSIKCYPSFGGAVDYGIELFTFSGATFEPQAHATYKLDILGDKSFSKVFDLEGGTDLVPGISWQRTNFVAGSNIFPSPNAANTILLRLKDGSLRPVDKNDFRSIWNSKYPSSTPPSFDDLLKTGTWSCPLGTFGNPWGDANSNGFTDLPISTGIYAGLGSTADFKITSLNKAVWTYTPDRFSTAGTLIIDQAQAGQYFTYVPYVAVPKITGFTLSPIDAITDQKITISNIGPSEGNVQVTYSSADAVTIQPMQNSGLIGAGQSKTFSFATLKSSSSQNVCITATATSIFGGTDTAKACTTTTSDAQSKPGDAEKILKNQQEKQAGKSCAGLFYETDAKTGMCIQVIPWWVWLMAVAVILVVIGVGLKYIGVI